MTARTDFSSAEEIQRTIDRLVPLETEEANSGDNEAAHKIGAEIIRLQELLKKYR